MLYFLFSILLASRAFAQVPNCGLPAIAPDETQDVPKALDIDGVWRVVGGRECIPHSRPWQISLRRMPADSHTCGGSIISRDWVVTAAHCVNGNQNPLAYSVDVGRHQKDGFSDASYVKHPVAEVYMHPLYNPSNTDNDIALLKLGTLIDFNRQVSPICLPTRDVVNDQKCFVSGWGATQGTCCFGQLKQAMLPHISTDTCNRPDWWGNIRTITPSMLCAGFAQGTHGGCFGDSGGPYQCKQGPNGAWELLGIVSWGSSTCRAFQRPTVFGRTHYFLDFIELVTGLKPNSK